MADRGVEVTTGCGTHAADAVVLATGSRAVRPAAWHTAVTLHTATDAADLRARLVPGTRLVVVRHQPVEAEGSREGHQEPDDGGRPADLVRVESRQLLQQVQRRPAEPRQPDPGGQEHRDERDDSRTDAGAAPEHEERQDEEHGADADLAALFRGLPDDRAQVPRWGYVIDGKVTFRFGDREETYEAGDAYYVPPGHTPVHHAGAELVEFSPTEPLMETIGVVMANVQRAGAS